MAPLGSPVVPGIDQRGYVVGLGGGGERLDLVLDLLAGIIAQTDEVAPEHRGLVVVVELDGLNHHDGAQSGQHALHGAGVVILGGVSGKEYLALGVVYYICDLFGR